MQNLEMVNLLRICYVVGVVLPAVLCGTCRLTEHQNGGAIFCTKINQEKYISSIFEFGLNIQDIVQRNDTSTFSITILDSNLPEIEKWIYIPWQQIGDTPRYAQLVNSLSIYNSSVKVVNFVAFEGFQVLRTLDLGSNNISNYSFLGNVRTIQNLHLSHSNLDLDRDRFLYNHLITSKNLELINFSYCNISSLVISDRNRIQQIDLSYNRLLHAVDFWSGSHLLKLNIDSSSYINNIKVGVFHLRMSGLKSNFNFSLLKNVTVLSSLTLQDNFIYRLDNNIFNFKGTIVISDEFLLDLTNTKLYSISGTYFSKYTLNSLILSENNLTELKNYTFKNSNIQSLDMSKSNITYIDSTVFYGLHVKKLNLSKNKLKTLKGVFFNIEQSVEEIDLSFNPIKFIDKYTFANCTNLNILNLTNCYVRGKGIGLDSFAHLFNLKHMELSFVGTIKGKNIHNQFLRTLVIRNSNLTSLENKTFKAFNNLRQLYFPGTLIESIGHLVLQGLSNIKEIDLDHLFLKTGYISIFQNISSLVHLNLSYKKISGLTSLDFKGLTRLQTLNLSHNSIDKIDAKAFFDLKNLEVLSLSFNNLSVLPQGIFSTLKNLTYFDLSNNAILSFIIRILPGLDSLIYLDLSFNKVDAISFIPNSLKCLKYLNLQHNIVSYGSSLFYVDLFNLTWIDINFNYGSCDKLSLLLSFLNKRNISYKPLNPVFYARNIEGIVCN